MMFLQPLALLALPCIAIPLIIHWLNHRRHKPVDWAAMYFLKRAQKVNHGMARLRYWLLLMLRMLAIAVVILFLSRPLQTGYMASWTGAPAVQLVVLDMSPSMQAVRSINGVSMIEEAVLQLDEMRRTTGQGGLRVLFTHHRTQPVVLPDDVSIADSMASFELASTANIPATVEAALQWSRANASGPIDLWICSDLRTSDWQPNSQSWQKIVEEIRAMPAVRLNVLASPNQSNSFNAAIRVDRVVRRQMTNRTELVFDLRITQTMGDMSQRTVPLAFDIAGVRTTLDVELSSREQFHSGLVVPIDPLLESGFGVVSLPADGNAADNLFRFVFAKPKAVEAVVVADDPAIGSVLQFALERPASDDAEVKVRLYSPSQISQIDWENTVCIAWQTAIPSGDTTARLVQIIERGGSVIFYPPSREGDSSTLEPFKFQWMSWQAQPTNSPPWQPVDWRSDSDLLRHSASGQPLTVHEWKINEYREARGTNWIPLVKLNEKTPLLARIPTDRGSMYFLSTLPSEAYSNLVEEGVTLYVLMQRLLESGLSSVSDASLVVAGDEVRQDWTNWQRLDESSVPILDNQRDFCAAVYGRDKKLIAINRPTAEDDPQPLDASTLEQLLERVNYRVVEHVDTNRPLASEVWRPLAVCLVICLLVEAWMTMPRAARANERGSGGIASTATVASSLLRGESRI